MKIESLKISAFRCFDGTGQTINLNNLTCFVGPNASGKTSAMMALARLFGESRLQRQVIPSDFHLGPGEKLGDKSSRSLCIECRLGLPELDGNEQQHTVAVPEIINQMIVHEPGGTPYCRMRLEAKWTADGTPGGDIEQSVSWILTNSDDPAVIDDGKRQKVHAGDRGRIRVMYVPAARDPALQIRSTTDTEFGRLIRALSWDGTDESLKAKLGELQNDLAGLQGIQTINAEVQGAWTRLYNGRIAREVAFRALDEEPTELVKLLVPTFRPGEGGRIMVSGDLGDGLRSLFSLSLSIGLFEVEEKLRTNASASGFKAETVEDLPLLSIFEIEEPENHLSPHYLGRVVERLTQVASSPRSQVLISSHSPSILGRIQPDNVRYFLGHERTESTLVREVPLPQEQTDEAFKYVREAVRGFPELYFSRLVVLGEGPSEQIVLRAVFEAGGTPLDTHFISVVPLGGRHVNHFWRLLHGLEIPYITLLDLDREKEGAGWGRIQYIRNQLVLLYGQGNDALKWENEDGTRGSLDDDVWNDLVSSNGSDYTHIDGWISLFKNRFGIFFSTPLDLDFSMLEAFPDVYKSQAPSRGGPRLPPPTSPDYPLAVTTRMKQVLAADIRSAPPELGSTYSPAQRELFPWYKYLFNDGSKPVAHMRALLDIEAEDLRRHAPGTLLDLVERVRSLVGEPDGGA